MDFFYRKSFKLFLFLVFLFLISLVFFSFFSFQKNIFSSYSNFDYLNKIEFSKDTIKKDEEIILIAVGDIMLDRGVLHMIDKYGEGDFKFPFLEIKEHLSKADILFGNLESVISDKGENVGSIYSFRTKPEALEGLKFTGFNVLSVANNHSFDYGRLALEDSMNRLNKNNIKYVGGGFNRNESREGILKEIKDTKIIFLAYTGVGSKAWQVKENSSGINWISEDIIEDINKAKEKADLAIVSFHFGEEYELEENKNQEYWAKLAIDSGADLIIGHHPHVIQPIKEYKDKTIIYSLGNFLFDQYFSEETMQGILVEVIIKNKNIEKVTPKKFKINEFYQPYFEK